MTGIAQKIIANPDSFSIKMLTDGVQDGTVPAYIGVPLIQEKMEAQKKQAALMGNAQQGQPPIAQEVLTQAAQSTAPVGIPGLQSNLPVATGAAGGIVAFAEGGYADDEEDDLTDMSDDEKQLFDILRSRMASSDEYEEMAGIGALPAGVAKAVSTKREVSSKVGNEPKQTKTEGITQLTKEGTPAGDLINKIMQKESGGRRYDKDGNLLTSPKGAQGEMQVMPGTARDPGFGIRPARAGDADDLARVGREYFGKMMDKYGDPKLAAIAYNWGPGNTDKWLMAGADPSKLPRETQKYSADMAAGGEVRHFQVGGVNNPFDRYASPEIANQIGIIDQQINDADEEIKLFKNNQPPVGSPEFMGWKQKLNESMARKNALEVGYKNLAEQTGAARPYLGNMMQQGTGTGKPPEILKTPPPVKPAQNKIDNKPIAPEMSMVNPDEEALAAEKAARYQPPVEPVKAEEPAAVNPMGDYIGDYAAYLKEQRAENTKNKETNKYLALLQAGLGMMGGTSRYAGANIGQGASQGVAAYMAGRKQESADDRALQQGMLGLSRASLYDKMHSEDIKRRLAADKSREGFQKSQLGLKEQELGVNRQKVAALEKAAKAKNAATYGKLFKEFDDTADAAGIKADLAKRYGKKWNEDAKANGEYKLLKAQSIAQMMLGGELDNAIKMSTDY